MPTDLRLPHRIRTTALAVIASLTTFVVLALGAPAALAHVPPPDAGSGATLPITTPIQVTTHSSPLWTFAVVAILTAIATVALTLLVVSRLRHLPRPVTA